MANDERIMEKRRASAQVIAQVGSWELDLLSREIKVSPEALRILGLSRSPALSFEAVRQVVHPEDLVVFDQVLAALIENNENYDLEFRVLTPEGAQVRYIHAIAEADFDQNGQAVNVIGVVHDITEKKHHERMIAGYMEKILISEQMENLHLGELEKQKDYLQRSEEKYRVLVDNSADGIFSCDADGRFTAANQRFCQIVGLANREIIGRELNGLPEMDAFLWSWYHIFQKMLKQEKAQFVENTRETGGAACYYSLSLVPLFGKQQEIIGAIGTCHDISEIKKHDQMVSHFAYDDPLTGLPNRRFFEQSLSLAIQQARKRGTRIAILFLDCDNFQKINDTLGHRVGDEVLQIVARHLKNMLQKKEVLARFAGDEFSIYVPDIQEQSQADEAFNRIQQLMNQDIQTGINSINLKASIGVAVFPDDGDTAEELMKNADAAMYKAKRLGKNNCQFYDRKLKTDLLKKIDIEKNLSTAMGNHELFVHYQPQIDLQGKIRGCEALLRWQSQVMGRRVPPSEMIPVAEETSLIRPIGEWVLETACRQAKEWQEEFGFCGVMSVNISSVQLYQNNFAATVKRILAESGLSPKYLELEITETVLITSFESVIQDIEELRGIGVKISLDDFGTGYSSLNYLRKLPVDTLKIDKSFIDHIEFGAKEKSIMRFVFSLIHELNLEVIAEGVETTEQYDYLEEHQCDFIQGYLLHRPLRKEEFGRLLARRDGLQTVKINERENKSAQKGPKQRVFLE